MKGNPYSFNTSRFGYKERNTNLLRNAILTLMIDITSFPSFVSTGQGYDAVSEQTTSYDVAQVVGEWEEVRYQLNPKPQQ